MSAELLRDQRDDCFWTEFLRHWRADFGDAPPRRRGEHANDDQHGLPNWFEMYRFGKL
jgi:hypothetical protein